MTAYADSSFLLAYFDPHSAQSRTVHRFAQEKGWDYYWNPALRAEVRHNLRHVPEPERQVAWKAYRAVEKWGARLVTAKFHLESLLERADTMSAEDGGKSGAGTWDFLHLAAAEAVEAVFLTCDKAQYQAAVSAGLDAKFFGA